MDKRKKDSRGPRDFWEEIFGETFNEFLNMRRDMERIFQNTMCSTTYEDLKKKPLVYGFSVRIGPNGIPHVQQFGNTEFGKQPGKDRSDDQRREPLTDVIEAEDHITITFELPGVEKEDINMDLNENTLVVDVDSEFRKYHKNLDLPDELDLDTIEATYKNGVLDIIIKRKKSKPKKGRKIKIK